MSYNNHEDIQRKNARTGLTVLAIVLGMAGLSFAAVPLYDVFCRVTGFGGTTQVSENLPSTILDRTVTVQFNADTSPNMPWRFVPEQRKIKVQLGQRGITAYHATNTAKIPTTGTAIYNVTPLKVGKYFHKIQCFCFDEQTLKPKEDISMPVLFYVDPKMDEDPDMKDITTITLSYTFFPAKSQELDSAMDNFYEQ